jgi:hypothetical protein
MMIIAYQKKLNAELIKKLESTMHIEDQWPLNYLTTVLKGL